MDENHIPEEINWMAEGSKERRARSKGNELIGIVRRKKKK